MSAAASTPTGATAQTSAALAEDYAALRHGAGWLPRRRDVLRVAGPDAVSYLQGQCSQDLDALEVGKSADALLLTPQGKLDALVRVAPTGRRRASPWTSTPATARPWRRAWLASSCG